MYAVEIAGLTKYFRGRGGAVIKAVDDVSLQIDKGEIFCLAGPNGAGKTTFLKMLATLILPTRGSASVNGFDTVSREIDVKSSIGLVTGDERSFYWRLTGRQNLDFFATLYNLPPPESKRRIDELLNFLEVWDKADTAFSIYSTGIKQRFCIIRALLHNPPVLLIDEPTKSLDPGAAFRLRKFIREELSREQKKTIVFVTHQAEEARELSDRIGIMREGRVQVCGGKEGFDELMEIGRSVKEVS